MLVATKLLPAVESSLFYLLTEQAAKTAHEVNRAFCATQGDMSLNPWDETPENIKNSARSGVTGILTGKVTTPEESHVSWLTFKEADGYRYGLVKDDVAKTHPCMLPYDQLPEEQRHKDSLFFAVVLSFCA